MAQRQQCVSALHTHPVKSHSFTSLWPLHQFYEQRCQTPSPVDGGLVCWHGGRPIPDGCEWPRLQGLYQILHWDFGALRFTVDGQKQIETGSDIDSALSECWRGVN